METKPIKLSANENCYGCSPLVYQAIEKKYKDVYLYPDPNSQALKEKLASKYNVSLNNIVLGAGSVALINGLIQAFVKPGEEVLTFEKSFIAYGQLTEMHGHKCKFAPLTDLRCQPHNLLSLINSQTRLIFIANPNNPTGTIINHQELEVLLKSIPENIIVVIDEAYAEYVDDSTFPDSLLLQKTYKNLVILHSFSKIYGLAGLRIGFSILDADHAASLSAYHIPFSINSLAANAANAALEDESFIYESARKNSEERIFMFNQLKSLGFNTVFTMANFIYLWFLNNTEKNIVYNKLYENGIIICDLKIFGHANSLRIGIGNQETNKKIINILSKQAVII